MKKTLSSRLWNPSRILKWLAPVAVVGILAVLPQCGTKTSAPSGTFTAVYTNTLSTACGSCHLPGGSAAADGVKLDFSTQATAYSTLVGTTVAANDVVGTCGGVKLVAPSSPATSYLVGTLITSYGGTAFETATGTSCVPYAGHSVNLSADEESSLTAWIQNGAQNN